MPTDKSHPIARALHEARKRQGLSLRKLEALSGRKYSRSMLQRMEKSARDPSDEIIETYSRILSVPTNTFLQYRSTQAQPDYARVLLSGVTRAIQEYGLSKSIRTMAASGELASKTINSIDALTAVTRQLCRKHGGGNAIFLCSPANPLYTLGVERFTSDLLPAIDNLVSSRRCMRIITRMAASGFPSITFPVILRSIGLAIRYLPQGRLKTLEPLLEMRALFSSEPVQFPIDLLSVDQVGVIAIMRATGEVDIGRSSLSLDADVPNAAWREYLVHVERASLPLIRAYGLGPEEVSLCAKSELTFESQGEYLIFQDYWSELFRPADDFRSGGAAFVELQRTYGAGRATDLGLLQSGRLARMETNVRSKKSKLRQICHAKTLKYWAATGRRIFTDVHGNSNREIDNYSPPEVRRSRIDFIKNLLISSDSVDLALDGSEVWPERITYLVEGQTRVLCAGATNDNTVIKGDGYYDPFIRVAMYQGDAAQALANRFQERWQRLEKGHTKNEVVEFLSALRSMVPPK